MARTEALIEKKHRDVARKREEKASNDAAENPFWFAEHTFHAAPLGITVSPATADPTAPTACDAKDGILLVGHPEGEGWNWEVKPGMLIVELAGEDCTGPSLVIITIYGQCS